MVGQCLPPRVTSVRERVSRSALSGVGRAISGPGARGCMAAVLEVACAVRAAGDRGYMTAVLEVACAVWEAGAGGCKAAG